MWRDQLRPASFRGARFHIDAAARSSGRRGQTYEYPNRDDNTDEDLGLIAPRWSITGYVVGPDYTLDADDLEAALAARGPGLLIHPLMGEMDVRCLTYTRSERRTEGGVATFDMAFVAAPAQRNAVRRAADTEKDVQVSAYALNEATLIRMDSSIKAGPK